LKYVHFAASIRPTYCIHSDSIIIALADVVA